ncbi:MAG TPA: hypothetical protein VKE27_05680 [Candidatus Dormibacteraeota bacterium]|nr:hypothetical protein [Candidatus Dormibacteraeota bacterium]
MTTIAATAAASFVLLWASAMPAFAFASPNPNANPDNEGHHYGWYKHPVTTPPPATTPPPISNAAPKSHPVNSPVTAQGNQDPPAEQSLGVQATPAAILLPAQPAIVVEPKTDDLALWVIYVLLAGLALLWLGLAVAASIRSYTGRPAPKHA